MRVLPTRASCRTQENRAMAVSEQPDQPATPGGASSAAISQLANFMRCMVLLRAG